eukprot:293888_1
MIPKETGANTTSDHKETDIEDGSKTKFRVMTWNLYAMIFTKRTLSNPKRCANYFSDLAQKEDWKSFNGLIVSNFQELWSWKTGLFPPFLLRLICYFEYIPFIGALISWIFQFISLFFGTIPILSCLPIQYDPKWQVAVKLRGILPYSYSKHSIRWQHWLDNGLLILSNHPANKYGSYTWQNTVCDDSLANKGFVWAYFAKFHCLVINVHLQSAGDGSHRKKQIVETIQWVKQLTESIRNEFENDDHLKIIATGDWNIDMHDHEKRISQMVTGTGKTIEQKDIEAGLKEELKKHDECCMCCKRYRNKGWIDIPDSLGGGWKKVNGDTPTMIKGFWSALDHTFVNFDFEKIAEAVHGNEKNLSDHLLLYNDFRAR